MKNLLLPLLLAMFYHPTALLPFASQTSQCYYKTQVGISLHGGKKIFALDIPFTFKLILKQSSSQHYLSTNICYVLTSLSIFIEGSQNWKGLTQSGIINRILL